MDLLTYLLARQGTAKLKDGKIPSEILPSYIDDVIEGYFHANKFWKKRTYPITGEPTYEDEIIGELGKIYIDLDTNYSYRWIEANSRYLQIGGPDYLNEKPDAENYLLVSSGSGLKINQVYLNNYIEDSEKGIPNGVAVLDSTGKVPKNQLPSIVPDGGTSGQVLTKQSGTDGDADWENIPTVAPIIGQITLLANSWIEDQNESGVYKQSITIPSSNTNSKVDIVPSATIIDQMLADEVKSLYIENNAGVLSAVAVGAEPSADMTIQYQMVIVVSTGTSGLVTNINDIIQSTGDEVILNGGTSTGPLEDIYPNANGISF